jgi:hypothetical protein
MKSQFHPFPENSLVANCIGLAQTTFFEAMPARSDGKEAPAAATAEPFGTRLARWASSLEDWFYRQQLKDREAYLAQSGDVFEVERRLQDTGRRPYY